MTFAGAAEIEPFAKWEKDIQKFEKADREKMPPANAVLFVGSSSIGKWTNLTECFPNLTTIRRGFGGSQMADLLHFHERLILPYKPKTILIYEGDNDLAAGKKAETIVGEYKELAQKIHRALPDAKIYFISVKPSPSRLKYMDEAKKVNSQIAKYSRWKSWLEYIDIWKPMLGPDGQPMADLFVSDNLHLNGKGYALWTKIIAPKIQ